MGFQSAALKPPLMRGAASGRVGDQLTETEVRLRWKPLGGGGDQ